MLEWLFAGGPTMVPLALASVLALTLIFERLLALRSERVLPSTVAPPWCPLRWPPCWPSP